VASGRFRLAEEDVTGSVKSRRVLEKAGFKFEGRIRKSFFSRGVYRDTAMYSNPARRMEDAEGPPAAARRELNT
jgi:8-oxo-dGTP pyrophosphatase MutT (NUDIX family)